MYLVEYKCIFSDVIYFLLNINIFSMKEIYFIENKYLIFFLNIKYFSFNRNIFY